MHATKTATKTYSQIVAESDFSRAFTVDTKATVRGLLSQHNRIKDRLDRRAVLALAKRNYRSAG